MYPLSKPLVDAIVEAKNHNACIHEINILEALCTTGATLESLSKHERAPYWAYWYAADVIKGRWPEAEAIIINNSKYAYWYARDVIKGRWPEAETVIATSAEWASRYARDVIKVGNGLA